MCGIAGIYSPQFFANHELALPAMLSAIRHRGPDATGIWQDDSAGLSLGHVRLSILDLTSAGAQPMVSTSGRYVIVFNGEIYNHLAIRAELENLFTLSWRGHSDTETLLAGIEAWGLEGILRRCVGMFALAVWDSQTQVLQLARDRLGEKPLYYCAQDGQFAFASELKALRLTPGFARQVDREGLCLLLKHGYIPAPRTIYAGVSKLLPGQIITVAFVNGVIVDPEVKVYWSFDQIRAAGQDEPFVGSDAEAVETLDAAILESVRGQMLADVPLGAFLSGGVDSSTIVGMMQATSSKPVKTFSIGFNEAGYSELAHARAVAEHLKTDHTELVVTPEDALAVIPQLPEIYDEPFADVSQIPTYLVSRLAKTEVTVSLSGDGGDELLCGYNRYIWGQRLWRKVSRLPLAFRRILAAQVLKVPVARWDQLLHLANCVVPRRQRFKAVGNKLHRLATALGEANGVAFYEALTAKWLNPEDVVLGLAPVECPPNVEGLSVAEMMAMDTKSYLPDDILVKVDRAAMACSLETRVPLLDHRIVALAWRLPERMKLRDGEGKWVLKQVLDRYVPRALMARPKMGFDVPLDSWLRGPLRGWAENLLSVERLLREGYFDAQQVRRKWEEHLSGRSNWQGQLWCVLMFQAWLEKNDS
jgi:asparagine synthase (glutamine-hydrolysing)